MSGGDIHQSVRVHTEAGSRVRRLASQQRAGKTYVSSTPSLHSTTQTDSSQSTMLHQRCQFPRHCQHRQTITGGDRPVPFPTP